jgi:DNA-directed RNA polymerase subunit omega
MPEEEKEENNWKTDIDSKYRLVIVAAKRSKQLQKGARPRIQTGNNKPTRVALEEVQHGLVRYETLAKRPGSN